MDIDPDKFFSKSVFAGSHENAVLALVQGTVDVCANWWNAPDDSNLTRMLNKGMLKNADGSPMTKDDFRIILKSELIINSPYAYLSDLPEDLKDAIKKAFLEAATKDKEAFAKLSDGKNRPWEPVANADYDRTIEFVKFVDELKKEEELSALEEGAVARPPTLGPRHAQRRHSTAGPPARRAESRVSTNRAGQAHSARFRPRGARRLAVDCPRSRRRSTPRRFLAKRGGFTSYFDRLATLDSGARVWTDPVEWFWSFKRSARLIGETVLMAYVGTLTGAVVALALNFSLRPI